MRMRGDKSRVIFVGRKFPNDAFWEVWKVRAIDGHTIQNLKNTALSIKLTTSHYDLTPCIAHGTQIEVIHSTFPADYAGWDGNVLCSARFLIGTHDLVTASALALGNGRPSYSFPRAAYFAGARHAIYTRCRSRSVARLGQ